MNRINFRKLERVIFKEELLVILSPIIKSFTG
jgi:hypothetical protein